MNFDMEKYKMVLHHIINKCGFKNTVGRTVLHKLLYFSDFNYYEQFNQSITNESYRKMERGPVPIHFEEAIEELVEEGKISLGKRRLPCGKIMNRYFSRKNSASELSNDELRVINKVIKDLSYMNGNQIGEYSLRDGPVKRANDGEVIDYEAVFSRELANEKKVFVKIE